ncbi:MAG TPA: SCO family protein [Candidatus Binatia bacterium]|jgi:protein SCO1/2|nr:SCO family protein [Candidatus Binatia bacterium]
MNQPPRSFKGLLWTGLILGGATVLLAFLMAALKAQQVALGKPLPVLAQVSDFTLTNQNGHAVSLASLRGLVWVGDIIFTRCPGPCLKMTRQMQELEQALPPKSSAKLVTLTTDPDFDTPPVLKTYAERFGADASRWLFLTGTKKQIAGLAIDSLKLTAIEKKPQERDSAQDLFVHSTIFVLVDKRGQLRGIFETTGEGIDPRQVQTQILAALRRLEHEP